MAISVNVSGEAFESASKKKKQPQELYDELAQLELDYQNKPKKDELPEIELPEQLELEKVEAVKKGEDELRSDADLLLRPKAEEELAGLAEDVTKDNKKLEKQAADRQEKLNIDAAETAERFSRQRSAAENSALSRGLARSSIIAAETERLIAGERGKLDEIQRQAAADIGYLSDSIELNENKLNAARENFDGELQKQIEAKLLSLVDAQEKKYAEALKFNNDVEKKQADYVREKAAAENARAKANIALSKNYLLYGAEKDRREFMENKVSAVEAFLKGMDKKEALELLEKDETIKKALGAYIVLVKNSLQ